MHIATKMHFLKLSCGCVAVVLISEKGASAVQVFWQGNGMSEDSGNTHFMLHLLSGRKDDSQTTAGSTMDCFTPTTPCSKNIEEPVR